MPYIIQPVSTALAPYGPMLEVRNSTHLRRWSVALGDAISNGSKQPVISCIGDSITTGALAHNSSSGAASQADRIKYRERGYVGVLRSMLSSQFGFAGEGFMFATPVSVVSSFQEDRVTVPSSASSVFYTGPLQSGRKIVAGETITWVTGEPCTQIDIIYASHPSTVAAFTYTIDGGSPVTATDPATTEAIRVESITGLADTTHTIVVTGPGTKYADIGGAIAKRTAGGVLVNGIARGGNTSSISVAPGAGTQAQDRMMAATFDATDTDLAIIMLRYNDRDGDAVSVANFKTYIQYMCDAAVSYGACVLLCPDPAGNYPGSPTATEDEYATAMQEISDATDHVAYTDLTPLWPSYADATELGIIQDTVVHPNSRGHGVIGRAMYELVTRNYIGGS